MKCSKAREWTMNTGNHQNDDDDVNDEDMNDTDKVVSIDGIHGSDDIDDSDYSDVYIHGRMHTCITLRYITLAHINIQDMYVYIILIRMYTRTYMHANIYPCRSLDTGALHDAHHANDACVDGTDNIDGFDDMYHCDDIDDIDDSDSLKWLQMASKYKLFTVAYECRKIELRLQWQHAEQQGQSSVETRGRAQAAHFCDGYAHKARTSKP